MKTCKLSPQQKGVLRSTLQGYAWPGGYPVVLVTSDGGCLCPKCFRSELRQIIRAVHDNDGSGGWYPSGSYVNWENPDLYCDHCGNRIESAYAEDKVTE